jgi:photosystem II stability/assembly factor-like uncharacterized protein
MSKIFSGAFVFIALLAFVLCVLPSSSMSQEVQAWSNLDLYGGKIFDIAIDPTNPDKMFVGSYMGDGLFLTEDGGNSWRAVETENELEGEDAFDDHAVWAVKIASKPNTNIIWAAHNYWVEKSTDGGKTWTHIENSTMQRDCPNCGGQGDNLRFCRSLAIHPTDPDIIYVGTGGPYGSDVSGAIYKTVNGGETWTKMNEGKDLDFGVVDIDIDPQNNNIIWAVTDSAGEEGVWGGTLYRSGNGGETWREIFSLTPSGARYSTVAVKPNNSNVVFTGSGPGIIKHYSLDGGETWDLEYPIEWDSSYVQDLQFDPQDDETLYASWYRRDHPDSVWAVGRSSGGGESGTWKIYTTSDNDFCSLAVHPRNTKDRVTEVIFGGDFNLGIYKGVYDSQADDYTWTPVNNGINAVIVYDVAIDPNDRDHIIAGTFSGVYEKRATEAWSHILEYSTRSVQFHPTNSQIFYAGLEGQLAKTTDGGESWSFSNYLGWFNCFNDIAIDPTNTDTIFIAASYGEIYKSTDGGQNFEKVLGPEEYAFNTTVIDPSDHHHIFASGGNFYTPYVLGDLWESKDGGHSWTRTGLQNEIVNDVLIDPNNPNIMYAGCGYSGGAPVPIYKSRDGGATWSAFYEGIPGIVGWELDVWGTSGSDVFAAAQGYMVHYDGSTWTHRPIRAPIYMNGVWGSSGSDVFAVGDEGTILHYDGNSWSKISSGTTEDLNDVWGTSHNDVFAVGTSGTILRYDGNTWISMSSGTTEVLNGVWGSSGSDVFAVGDEGTILHYDGNSWSEISSGTTEALNGVWGSSGSDVFAVGGVILHYDGSTWSDMRPLVSNNSPVTDLEFHHQSTDILYASTFGAGVYISPNQARNWLNLGTPEHNVFAISTSSLYAGTQGGMLQCTGTGVIAGQVTDATSQSGIDGATVYSDMGVMTISVNGEYMMVSPSGICNVTAIADGYANKTLVNATVYGADVCWVDFAMQSGVSGPSIPGVGGDGGEARYGCFIATAACKFPLAKTLEILRTFREHCSRLSQGSYGINDLLHGALYTYL